MIQYSVHEDLHLTAEIYERVRSLHDEVFQAQDAHIIERELNRKLKFLILLAHDQDRVVGYKVGYEDRTYRFYSWLGGVHPHYRGQGIASELMQRQHEWCVRQGYRVVWTHTKNQYQDMLILNVRHGFDIVGTYTGEEGEPRLILEKRLSKPSVPAE